MSVTVNIKEFLPAWIDIIKYLTLFLAAPGLGQHDGDGLEYVLIRNRNTKSDRLQ